MEGADLRKIFNGRQTNLGFDITPEYLSVVYRATKEDRCTLIDYLSKLHPGHLNPNKPLGFGSDSMKQSAPVACVGAIGSGDNDAQMLQKAKISFSTNNKGTDISKDAADMVLMQDSLEDVVMAVTKGR